MYLEGEPAEAGEEGGARARLGQEVEAEEGGGAHREERVALGHVDEGGDEVRQAGEGRGQLRVEAGQVGEALLAVEQGAEGPEGGLEGAGPQLGARGVRCLLRS